MGLFYILQINHSLSFQSEIGKETNGVFLLPLPRWFRIPSFHLGFTFNKMIKTKQQKVEELIINYEKHLREGFKELAKQIRQLVKEDKSK